MSKYPSKVEDSSDINDVVVSDSEDDDCDNNVIDYDPSECDCELCYLSREICEYIQEEKDRENEDPEDEELLECIENEEMKKQDENKNEL